MGSGDMRRPPPPKGNPRKRRMVKSLLVKIPPGAEKGRDIGASNVYSTEDSMGPPTNDFEKDNNKKRRLLDIDIHTYWGCRPRKHYWLEIMRGIATKLAMYASIMGFRCAPWILPLIQKIMEPT